MINPSVIFVLAALGALPNQGTLQVPLQIDPPQRVKAIVLSRGDAVEPVPVRDHIVEVPTALGLPWTVHMAHFEATVYTQDDLTAHRPLVVRQLGTIRGLLRRKQPKQHEHFLFLLKKSGSDGVEEIEFAPTDEGSFEVAAAAGSYEGAVIGPFSATRIRAGIVVASGQTTDLGTMQCEPTATVTVRVVDSQRGAPVANARVSWDPPLALNASTARTLYAKRWSSTTDARGLAVLPSIGPIPIPVRWSVHASAYGVAQSRTTVINEARAFALPDVVLKSEPSVLLHLRAYDAQDVRDAVAVLAQPDEINGNRFVPYVRTALRADTRLSAQSYGRKRLWIESAAGHLLAYRDFDVDRPTTPIDLDLTPVEIHGTIVRRDDSVAGAIVRAADPHDAAHVLGTATSDASGAYRLRVYQRGRLFLYAVEATRSGFQSAPMERSVDIGNDSELRVDFELPSSGASIRVIDAATGNALRATAEKRIELAAGGQSTGIAETGDDGRLTLRGFPDGVAHLDIHAAGHRARHVDVPLTADMAEMEVALEAGGAVYGHVLDATGAPIGGARISGGYDSPLAANGHFRAITAPDGLFHFDATPDPGTTFYIVAPGHALAIATLQAEQENAITLSSPTRSVLFVLPDNAPPTHGFLVLAAPQYGSGELIPQGVLRDLAELNGLNGYQLLGLNRDGSLVLPQYLPPGTYMLLAAVKSLAPENLQRIGSVSLPSPHNTVLAFKTH